MDFEIIPAGKIKLTQAEKLEMLKMLACGVIDSEKLYYIMKVHGYTLIPPATPFEDVELFI